MEQKSIAISVINESSKFQEKQIYNCMSESEKLKPVVSHSSLGPCQFPLSVDFQAT